MSSLEIISFARIIGKKVPENLISNDEMLVFLNDAYSDFYDSIVSLDRNYFWDKWTTSTIANQYEYSILKPETGVVGIGKPEKIRIKYSSTDEFVDVEFRDWDSLEYTPEEYAEKQPKDKPFAIITDTNYFHIFPTPLVAVEGGLILEWAKEPYELTLASADSDILIKEKYHKVIAYMMLPAINFAKGYVDEKNDAINTADMKLRKALKSMGLLTTKVIRAKIKDLSHLE